MGLHRYVRRRDTPDPNLQVCVQCGKQRIADAIWGVLGGAVRADHRRAAG